MDPYKLDSTDLPKTEGFHAFVRFLRVVSRHRMILIICLIAGGVFGFAYYSRQPKQFESSAKLLVTQRESSSGRIVFKGKKNGTLATYRQLILSDHVLRETVSLLETRPPELIGNSNPGVWPKLLRGMLTVEDVESEETVVVSCRSADPESTVNVINALLQASDEFLTDYQKNISVELIRELETNRKAVKERLDEKELHLLEARRRSGDISINANGDDKHPVAERVSRLNTEIMTVNSRRLDLQSALMSAQQLVAVNGDLSPVVKQLEQIVGETVVAGIPGATGVDANAVAELESQLKTLEAELSAMSPHFGVRHSEVIRRQHEILSLRSQIAETRMKQKEKVAIGIRDPEIGRWVVAQLESALSASQRYEGLLRAEYQVAEREAEHLSDALAAIQNAEREANTLREVHTSLLTRLNSIEIDHGAGRFRVAPLSEPLVPGSASYPVLQKTMVTSVGLAFIFAMGIIYVIDLADDRLASPEEVRDELGLSVLGVIRKLPEHEIEQARIYVHGFPQTPHAECFRSLKTAISLSAMETKCLAVTSTEASEGKTTTTVNLAASYAQTGQRTLLIDADMRRPGLSRLLEVRGNGGLSEILRSETDIPELCAERIVQTEVEGLEILPCGPRILNAGMLLSMPSLADILDWAVSKYDQVIVDCPPTLPVSDAAIVGRYVDGMLFLMNPDKTHRRSVTRAVDNLRSLGLKIVGIVANTSLSEDRNSYGYQYGYGYGYGADYSYGHDEEDELRDGHSLSDVGKAA